MLRLKFERLKRDLSQGEIAILVGITQPMVSLCEQGRLRLTPDQLDRIAQVLGISPPEVLMREVLVLDGEAEARS